MDGSPVTLSVEDDGVGGEGPSMEGINIDDLSRSSSTSTFVVQLRKTLT